MSMFPLKTTRSAEKIGLHAALSRLAEAESGDIFGHLSEIFSPNVQWRSSHPLNEMTGLAEVENKVWQPLKAAFPDLERRDSIFVGGEYEGRTYIAAIGHYCGTFRHDWLTIPATGRPVWIRYG